MRDLDFVVDGDNLRLVDKTSKPFFGESSVPRCVYSGRIGGSDPGSIRIKTISGIRFIRVELLLV